VAILNSLVERELFEDRKWWLVSECKVGEAYLPLKIKMLR
jgi:hypothetical protein